MISLTKGVIHINREQKRKYTQKLKAKGFNKQDIDLFLRYKELSKTSDVLPEGINVKLDIDNIKSHPDYEKLTEKYRNWVEENKDKTFTVEYDYNKKSNPITVCLKEDESDPKWLFWVGDLKVVEDN